MRVRALMGGLLLLGAQTVMAQEHSHAEHAQHAAMHSTISIHDAWARALPPNAPSAAVYLQLHNHGAADVLVAASTSAAEKTEVHSIVQEADVMKMRQLTHLDLPAGKALALAPGGLHLMLLGLKQPMIAGQSFPLELEFKQAGKQQVEVKILEQAPTALEHEHAHH